VRPFFISITVALAAASATAHAQGARWTPLTGLLAPDSATPPGSAPSVPTETSSTQKPELPKADTAPGDAARLVLKVALVRDASGGAARGTLGIDTVAVDADLAQGLGLASSQGALVTSASTTTLGAAGLLPGDVIETLDGRAIGNAEALADALKDLPPERQVSVGVRRVGAGAQDLKRVLVDRAKNGNVGAAASLARFYAQGLVFGDKNASQAATYYLKAAQGGHLASMTRYALYAKDGIGMPKNEALAAQWFRSAAEGGQDAAMTNLGTLYEAGLGVPQDYSEAARWYRAAVDKGHVFAMHRLALLYETGRGVKTDDQEAVRLLQAASDKGLSEATSWLADKYELGRGVAKNEEKAAELNTRAAEQVRTAADRGNAVATFNLGILYRIGKGVKQSDTDAAFWVVKSLKLGDKYLVSELMRNPAVLSEADRKWLQQVLRDQGAYKGPIDGMFTPEVRTAMEQLGSSA
jgi:TPR repeat protein